jgi:hypothetical protein
MKILIFLFVAITFFSCGKKDGATSDSKQTISDTKPGENGELKFEEKKFLKSYYNCLPSDTCTYFELSYPEAAGGKLKDKINSFLMKQILSGVSFGDTTYSSIPAAADSFIAAYTDFRQQEQGYNQFWYFEYFMRVANETPALVSIEASNSSYLGGAHPNSYTEFFNISKETGDTVSLSDIFVKGFEVPLNKLIDAKYRELKGLKPNDNLQEKGELFDNKIEFNYNFSVGSDGSVMFFYNNYEIAPYAAGPLDIKLSKKELVSIINPNGPLK